MRWLPRALATTTACVLLAGCGGNPTPAPPPKATSTPSPTASASPTPPALPAAATAKTKAGALAAATSFISTLNYAVASGDTAELRSRYIALCTRCEDIANGIDRTYGGGGTIRGGEWTVTATKFYAIKNEVAYVDAIVDYSAQKFTSSSGAKVRSFPATKRHLKAFNLRWSRGSWRVSALDPNQLEAQLPRWSCRRSA